ncbi:MULTISPECIES: AraC family transcriptional regulator [Paenibacillus]|uniref:Transcriptional regulator AraC family protein n=1 Tax=Paenibacillus illinoisensis TaxID=59845 RepID=A0A2W0C4T7_9BACL|nr:AraC family transcriptional regulator [Paenibacillus illinoisensis]PYY26874.1 Transcriptional regulator AraC family protein [Paenibacillus illinoisensis]
MISQNFHKDRLVGSEHPLDRLTLKIRDIEKIKSTTGWVLPQQHTSSYILVMVTGGEALLTLDHRSVNIRAQGVYSCVPESTFGLASFGEEGAEVTLVRFDLYEEDQEDTSSLRLIKDTPLFRSGRELAVASTLQLAFRCEEMNTFWHSGKPMGRYHAYLEFLQFLVHVTEAHTPLKEDSQMLIQRTKEYIDEHSNENLTVELLAGMAGLSPKYYVDLFKRRYGMSTTDYISGLRINRAKQFMASTDLRLRDIAHQVGYQDEFYFSRKFKKIVGVSPSVYMNSRRRKIAAYHIGVTGHLLALNMTPYAAPLHPKWTAYYYRIFGKDIPVHLSAYRLDVEWESKIQALQEHQPELIISYDHLRPEERKRLEEIAPVQYIAASEHSWRVQLQMLAAQVGGKQDAEAWLASYDLKVQKAKVLVQQELGNDTAVVVRLLKQQFTRYSSPSMAEVFYGDLGVRPAYSSPQGAVYNEPISLEQLSAMKVDCIFLMVCQESETLSVWEDVQKTSLWQNIKAVQNNRLYIITADPWLENSPVSNERMVDDMMNLLR